MMLDLNDPNITLPRLLAHSPLRGRNLLSVADLSVGEVHLILFLANKLRTRRHLHPQADEMRHPLDGKHLALLFEKQSLRTRATFDIGMKELGGHPLYLSPDEVGLGERETAADIAQALSRYVHGIAARVFDHHHLTQMAAVSTVPIINALSDLEHPCQALADVLTLEERRGRLDGVRLAWIGDGNNVCHSLALLMAQLGAHVSIASPAGYAPEARYQELIRAAAKTAGTEAVFTADRQAAARGADAIATDTWVSMGQEADGDKRRSAFAGWQVNQELLALAKPDALVLHCLPAHRGDEITDEVMDGPQSAVWDEAENRLHVAKAVLLLTLGAGSAA